MSPIRLTQYSSGAGCGCKIAPGVLDEILAHSPASASDPRLLVGNENRDDAAAWLLEDQDTVLLSTTDFFMPIVDDPFDFGRIASANAISDVYAMGGRPVLALAVLGWPLEKLGPGIARAVIEGARAVCAEAGNTLAGGPSIDSPEPVFGLAVNGLVRRGHLKTNGGARPGDLLFLTKALGTGILATAEKRGGLRDGDVGKAAASMIRLNRIGSELALIPGVHALTDVTGFGLLGHLLEMCRASGVAARIEYTAVPQLADLASYVADGMIPGGSGRNWESYRHEVDVPDTTIRSILCDPQTSGGLLAAVDPLAATKVAILLEQHGLASHVRPVGRLMECGSGARILVEAAA
jgi:selenide,water dikinase